MSRPREEVVSSGFCRGVGAWPLVVGIDSINQGLLCNRKPEEGSSRSGQRRLCARRSAYWPDVGTMRRGVTHRERREVTKSVTAEDQREGPLYRLGRGFLKNRLVPARPRSREIRVVDAESLPLSTNFRGRPGGRRVRLNASRSSGRMAHTIPTLIPYSRCLISSRRT